MLLLHRMFIWPQRFLHYVNCQQALGSVDTHSAKQFFEAKTAYARKVLTEGGLTRYASQTSQRSKIGHLASIFDTADVDF